MYKGTFTYSLIKYTHSRLLNESIVVGLIFYFPAENKIILKAPEKFNRLKSLYSDFNDNVLRSYLKVFKKIEKDCNNYLLDFEIENFELFLHENFLRKDYSTIEFGIPNKVVVYNTFDNIVRDYTTLYLSEYNIETNPLPIKRHNEEYILKTIKNVFNKKSVDIKKYFKENVHVGTLNTSLKFDYAWQNGSLNLIKGISFDLTESNRINEKAILYFGNLSLLNKEATDNNYRFDLLVTRPQDKLLFNAYDNALKILEQSTTPMRIVEEEGIDEYADYAITTVLTHE